MPDPLLKVSNLRIEAQHQVLLDHISFQMHKKETVAVIGPNGAGKTTLFRALLGLIPYEGTIEWQKGITIGYVPQKLFIERDFPLTIGEFFALKGRGAPTKAEIDHACALVGFGDHATQTFLRKQIGVLSGGELQRILIAWACVGHPDVLLFDEPTSGVDISSEETIYGLLHKMQEKENLTVLLISHELDIVYKYATNVLCLNKKAVCFGPPKEALDKESLFALFGADVGLYRHH